MHIEAIRNFCLEKKHTREGLPFDEQTLVFYVADKMFALVPLDEEQLKINLKCDPDRAIELREKYNSIKPGFHMNKKHWNTIQVEAIGPQKIYELIDHSYDLVVSGLPKKKQIELGFL